MIKIQFPETSFKTKKENGIDIIFDTCRKKWVVLTPEEWVRQNFLEYLITVKQYPASLIAVEKEIKLGELKKRCDIVVYDRESKPWMIIECKEMNAPLNKSVLEQALRYHITLPSDYLVITNGTHSYGFIKQDGRFTETEEMPDYL